MIISIGESRKATHWLPREVSWEQLCHKLETPIVTEETVAEYQAMSKDQRAEIKDVGGYVGGCIAGGNRKAGNITDRQLICLDADYGDLGLWDSWDLLVGNACLMHTSHSHTPENPRLRFVIPLKRSVTAAEYEPIARRIADWLGIDAFDDTTYEASRLMYWSSKPKDGEFICRVYEGDWIDPDKVLATYEDWHDMRSWPTSSRRETAITRMGQVQGDPLTKPGVIGAFNRAYTITEAIETFLPEVYGKCEGNRWTYLAGSSTGGAVTYDNDTFIYSHHDTDPISKRLCNAFDMVRIHLFGEQDEGCEAEIGDLPSMNNMKALCQNDEKVREELAKAVVEDSKSVFEAKVDLQRFSGDMTEQGLSVVLSDTYGYGVQYNKAFGWVFWDGTKWVLDADFEAAMLVMKFTDDMYAAARMHMQLAADKAAQEVAKREFATVVRLRTAPGISHLVTLLKTEASKRNVEAFDANAWDLNTPDGIIDLRTGAIRDHDRKAYCTKCTEVSPGNTGVQKWYDFIQHITNGDQEFADYLQMLAGMAAIGNVYEEGLVISYGSGSNGKSTFFGALGAVLGDYAKTINSDVIVSGYGKNTDSSYIAALRGARMVVLGETEESAVLSSSSLKKITSRDVISARSLYKDPIEFKPTHTTIMHTNHLPRLTSLDGGTKRRIAVAPFPATLAPERVITNYMDVLVSECGPAILQWIIDGAVRFYNAGCKLPKPDCVLKATQDYIESEDVLGGFLSDKCRIAENAEVRSSDLYGAYQCWAGENGLKPKGMVYFAKDLEARGFRKIRHSSGIRWLGLQLQGTL